MNIGIKMVVTIKDEYELGENLMSAYYAMHDARFLVDIGSEVDYGAYMDVSPRYIKDPNLRQFVDFLNTLKTTLVEVEEEDQLDRILERTVGNDLEAREEIFDIWALISSEQDD